MSSNLSLASTLTPVPYEPPSSERSGPREQAVQQGDTDVRQLERSRATRGVGSSCGPQWSPRKAAKEVPITRSPRAPWPGGRARSGSVPVRPSALGPGASNTHCEYCELRLCPWAPRTPPAPRLESTVTFTGLVHAPIPGLGGDWSSRRASAPGTTATRSRPALVGVGGLGASRDQPVKQTSGMSIGDSPTSRCPKPLGAPNLN